MTSEGLETGTGGNVPELDSGIIAGREEKVLLVNLDFVDQIAVALQGRALTSSKVPDLDSGVDGSRGEDARVEIKGDNTIGVSLKGTDALAGMVVPDLECAVH